MTNAEILEKLKANGYGPEAFKGSFLGGGLSIWSSAVGATKEKSMLEQNTFDDEQPVGAIAGSITTRTANTTKKSNVMLYLTTNRILFLDAGLLTKGKTTSYDLSDVNSISDTSGFFGGSLSIKVAGSVISLTGAKKDFVAKFVQDALKAKATAKKSLYGGGGTTVVQGALSPMEEVKKAKELLDGGIISAEEFEAIKKKHLG